MTNLQSPLLTDFYQLTMAHGYWQLGRTDEAVFQLTFRKNPFQGNYTVACGLQTVIEYLQNYHFPQSDIDYLDHLKAADGSRAFPTAFLNYLSDLKFTCDVDAIPEGTIVFPQEPLLRIKGPLIQCQLLETPLLNFINFASLVATRAAQICDVAKEDPVVEFGLRRAQGPDGGMTATRATYIGGCESTSNVLAGKEFNIPVKGTVAHSWILSYDNELTAFREFVKTCPITILLVDTYNTLDGVANAIIVGKELRAEGRDLMAIRLDSGDLLKLSKKSRQLLDKAGFHNTKILASGDLDLEKITYLKKHRAPIDIWGVGTKLATAYQQPSLDAIYKLTALHHQNKFEYKKKFSDSKEKTTYPGILQVRRLSKRNKFVKDIIFDEQLGEPKLSNKQYTDLLVPIFRAGKLIYKIPSIQQSRTFCQQQRKDFSSYHNKKYLPQLDEKLSRLIKNL